jgi:hypothetical protein
MVAVYVMTCVNGNFNLRVTEMVSIFVCIVMSNVSEGIFFMVVLQAFYTVI